MTKKVLAFAVCLICIFTLSSCVSGDDAFESAMYLVTGEGTAKQDTGKPDADKPEDPETPTEPEDKTPDKGKENAPGEMKPKAASWPDDVPYVLGPKETSFAETDGKFTAVYLMTVEQLQEWTASLTQSGFVGNPRVKNGTLVEYTEKIAADNMLDVVIQIYPASGYWPDDYKPVPRFAGKGVIGKIQCYTDNVGTKIFKLIVDNETQESVDAYLELLKKNGFSDVGDGVMSKTVGADAYQFITDTDRIWAGTTATLQWQIMPAA